MSASFQIRLVNNADRPWIFELLSERWGSSLIVSRGRVYDAADLPGFAAFQNDDLAGLLTFCEEDDSVEIVTLDSLLKNVGVGRGLIDALKSHALETGCRRIWLITTNDNLGAMRFYQMCGFVYVAIYPNALVKSRELKPEIPEFGIDGIPLRDEIEMALLL